MRARGAVVATLVGVLLMSALYPIRQYVGQKSNVRELVAQERELSQRISDLRRQQGMLLSDDEIERIAREELGMVRQGEVAFAILPGRATRPATKPAAQAIAPRAAPRSVGWHQRWWDAIVHSLTGIR